MNVAGRLYELRQKTGLSQKEFAEKAGVSQAAINMWENGKRQPRIEQLQKIALSFSVPLNSLIDSISIAPMTEDDLAAFKYFEEHPEEAECTSDGSPDINLQQTHGTSFTVPKLIQVLTDTFSGDDFTDDEIAYIKKFAEFLKSQRNGE